MSPEEPWYFSVYSDIEHWSVGKLEETYRSLSRQLREFGLPEKEEDFIGAMFLVEHELRERGEDELLDQIAKEVQEEARNS